MYSNVEPPAKKHKKHKKEKDREKYDGDKIPTLSGTPGAARLKLILKVGGSSTPEHSDSPGPMSLNVNVPYEGEDSQHSSLSVSYSHIKKAKKKEKKKKKDKKHKHHHKEKKRKEKEELKLMGNYPIEAIDTGALTFTDMSEKKLFSASDIEMDDGNTNLSAVGSSREARLCVIKQRNEKQPLQKLLDHLYRTLEKKDPQQFFAWPVTDKIAPGYSQIIKQPMDFNTMKAKLDEGLYCNLIDFANDFQLMCNNAMVYNQPETIYYKAAKKLLQGGLKVLTPEKIRPLLAVIPSIQNLSEESLGFPLFPEPIPQEAGMSEINQSEEENQDFITLDPMKSEHYMPPHPYDPPDISGGFTDDFTPQEILQQARLAAREASHKLATKKPNSKMGFLRQRPDGSTSLAILTPYSGVTPGTQDQPISLGAFSGKITQGSVQLQAWKDAGRQSHRTLKPLVYGSFSSYAPHQDTTFASLTDEETELLRSTYGESTSIQYSESMIEFAKGCDYALQMVDEILNTLTRGEHSKTVNVIEERKKIQIEEAHARKVQEELDTEWNYVSTMSFTDDSYKQEAPECDNEQIDFDAVKSLNDLGIDTSFVDDFEQESRKGVTGKLQENAELLRNLEKYQSQRLKQATQSVSPYCQPVSKEEVDLADKVVENLIVMAQQVNPGQLVPTEYLRKAMGIALRTQQASEEAAKVNAPTSVSLPVLPATAVTTYTETVETPS
ncbi:unnamed protein product [Allacma fusca]|uniref:Bromo domain-containing protein n=1 Tax=Allacma fusca TaxID=39272 RepID=A0A8J2NWL4_9HEXA|nr:unnamed protein product [Allacma fusca]